MLTTLLVDDPELQHGTPVGLQLVGRRLEEEKILGLVGMISEALSLTDRSA